MKLSRWVVLSSLCAVLALAGASRAETKVELKGVHICCPMCVKDIEGILKKAKVTGKPDMEAKTVTIMAKDAEAAQKAVDALSAAGYHGESDNKDVTMKDDSGAKAEKVKKLTVTGAHNCCGMCAKVLNETVKKVEGVKAGTAKAKGKSFEVTGDFDAAEVVKALNAAGFHVKVKE